MLRTGWAQTLDSLRKKLGSIESRAKMTSTQLKCCGEKQSPLK